MPNINVTVNTVGTWVRVGVANNKDVSTSGTLVARKVRTYRQGSTTPGFYKPNRGRLSPLPFSFELDDELSEAGITQTYTRSIKPGVYGYSNYQVQGVNVGSTNFFADGTNPDIPLNVSSSVLSQVDGLARNALLTKIKGQKVNAAVAAAESRKTFQMVGDTAIRIAEALRQLRHGNFREAARAVGVAASKRASGRFNRAYAKDRAAAVGSGWNALQYGWRPLLDDVYGACEEYATYHYDQGIVATARVRKSRSTDYRFSKGNFRSTDYAYRQTGKSRTDVRYSVTYLRAFGAPQDLPRLGITNPAVVAWELVPYSFVVDWFLPIGNWLGTLDATLGVTFLNGFKTTFQEVTLHQDKYLGDWSTTDNSAGFSSSHRKVRVYRTVLTDFPSPALPTFKNPVSFTHMLNGLALLTNLLRK